MGLIVKSAIKEVIPEMSVSEDVAVELEKKAEQILKDAEKRARANGRRTVFGRDL